LKEYLFLLVYLVSLATNFFLPWPQDFWSWWPPKLKSHFDACIVIEGNSVQQDKQSGCNKTIQNVDRSALSSSDT
jgi:hypothetical protein